MVGWVANITIYFMIWWLVLFMILPIGVRRTEEHERTEGEDHGAPAAPRLLLKFLATTVISALLFGIGYWLWKTGLISFRPGG